MRVDDARETRVSEIIRRWGMGKRAMQAAGIRGRGRSERSEGGEVEGTDGGLQVGVNLNTEVEAKHSTCPSTKRKSGAPSSSCRSPTHIEASVKWRTETNANEHEGATTTTNTNEAEGTSIERIWGRGQEIINLFAGLKLELIKRDKSTSIYAKRRKGNGKGMIEVKRSREE
jgi:hypothetical protein